MDFNTRTVAGAHIVETEKFQHKDGGWCSYCSKREISTQRRWPVLILLKQRNFNARTVAGAHIVETDKFQHKDGGWCSYCLNREIPANEGSV